MKQGCSKDIRIPVGQPVIEGRLEVPPDARALVIFAHGSGSSRFSPRNTRVAHRLQPLGFGTLLFDLLTAIEDRDPDQRNNIQRMTERLVTVTDRVCRQECASGLPVAYYGSSSGAAVAIAASVASRVPYALVSRGGRIDLVTELLPQLQSPIHLIAGEHDPAILALNETAYTQIRAVKKLSVIKDASPLFEEPGCMDKVARLAADWFTRHLPTHV